MFGQIITSYNSNTTDNIFPASACGDTAHGKGKGVWYKYNAEATGSATFSIIGVASWDACLRVFSGTCDALSCIGANDDNRGAQSAIKVPITAGQNLLCTSCTAWRIR